MKRLTWIAVCLAIMLSSACTVLDSEHRRTVDLLNDHLTPSAQSTRFILLPISIPVGLVAVSTDALIVNPVRAIDDAWDDTVELLWTPKDETSLRRVLIAPLATLATPIVFGFDWFWRCLWPLEPNEENTQ
ncbi:MAG: hypothetical protein ACI8TQ_000355 [Planctomycetota bacterium]|jgi:hypothetical protein